MGRLSITFGGAALGDDNTGYLISVEDWGGSGIEQVDPLAFSDFANRKMVGNTSGDFVFVVRHSHANYDAVGAYLAQEYARIGGKASSVVTFPGGGTITMANSTMRNVDKVEWKGLRLVLRYRIGITTMVWAAGP